MDSLEFLAVIGLHPANGDSALMTEVVGQRDYFDLPDATQRMHGTFEDLRLARSVVDHEQGHFDVERDLIEIGDQARQRGPIVEPR